LRRLPVFAFFFREYNRYSPDFILRIMAASFLVQACLVQALVRAFSTQNVRHFGFDHESNCLKMESGV
jgi:hypothetical protein